MNSRNGSRRQSQHLLSPKLTKKDSTAILQGKRKSSFFSPQKEGGWWCKREFESALSMVQKPSLYLEGANEANLTM
jgi:hypothetical protein